MTQNKEQVVQTCSTVILQNLANTFQISQTTLISFRLCESTDQQTQRNS